MRVVDRFTRDRVSRYLWGGLTLAFAILLVFASSGSRRALRDREAQAQARAVGYTESTLFRHLNADLVSKPILGPNYRALLVPVQAEIMTDPSVAALQIWGTDGILVFSTDLREGIGTLRAGDGPPLHTALRGETASDVVRASVSVEQGIPPTTERLYQTFVPLRVPDRTGVVGVAQIDMHLAPMIAASRSTWRSLEVPFAAGLALCLVMTLLSLRAPLGPAERHAVDRTVPPEVERGVAPATTPTVIAAPPPVPVSRTPEEGNERLRELEERLMQEQMRRAKAERAARDAELAAETAAAHRAQLLEIEIRTLRERLERAPAAIEHAGRPEGDAGAIRLELDAVRRELEGVRAEAEAARSEREAARADAERARDELADVRSAAGRESDVAEPAPGRRALERRGRRARRAARKRRSGERAEPGS
jgi:hypothetical protein